MSSPYVYTPQQYQAFQPTYLDPYYGQQPVNSPFIPDATLYPSSPYTSAPNTPRRVHFDDLWPDPPPRQRRPSWHAGLSQPISAQLPSSGYASPFLQPTMPFFSHTRRRSFGDTTSPFRGYYNPWTSTQSDTFVIHPYLDGETPRPDFHFDLSSPTFSPMRLVALGQSALLTADDLNQPATHPPITRLRIICDAIPLWPIELQYNPYASQGVRRVDYLLDKVVLRGLVRVLGMEGYETLRLVTG